MLQIERITLSLEEGEECLREKAAAVLRTVAPWSTIYCPSIRARSSGIPFMAEKPSSENIILVECMRVFRGIC